MHIFRELQNRWKVVDVAKKSQSGPEIWRIPVAPSMPCHTIVPAHLTDNLSQRVFGCSRSRYLISARTDRYIDIYIYIYMCTHNALACNKCALNHIQQQQRYAADVSVYLYLGQECKLQLANQDGCPLCHSGKWLMKMPCNAETVFIALLIRLSQNTQPRANKNAASSPWSRNISSLKVH